MSARKFPRKIKRVVIKLGSSLIATDQLKPSMELLQSLIKQISELRDRGIDVAIVSSGAIVLGLGELNRRSRDVEVAFLQASASVGQTILMRAYSDLFKMHQKICAQVLLTWDDFDDRDRFTNARRTLNTLFDHGVIPVINENDAISNDEIKFGDNDKLSAMVSSLVQADLLILLSDVDGIYEEISGKKEYLREVKDVKDVAHLAKGTAKRLFSKGGMTSKLEAIHIVGHAKIPCIIANGFMENVIERIMNRERVGTFFIEKSEKMLDRKHWISFGAKPKGKLWIDDGAREALLKGGRSLLLPGVKKWEGHFAKGDVVIIYGQDNHELARGLVNYSLVELEKIEEKKGKAEVIHCDDLILSQR